MLKNLRKCWKSRKILKTLKMLRISENAGKYWENCKNLWKCWRSVKKHRFLENAENLWKCWKKKKIKQNKKWLNSPSPKSSVSTRVLLHHRCLRSNQHCGDEQRWAGLFENVLFSYERFQIHRTAQIHRNCRCIQSTIGRVLYRDCSPRSVSAPRRNTHCRIGRDTLLSWSQCTNTALNQTGVKCHASTPRKWKRKNSVNFENLGKCFQCQSVTKGFKLLVTDSRFFELKFSSDFEVSCKWSEMLLEWILAKA